MEVAAAFIVDSQSRSSPCLIQREVRLVFLNDRTNVVQLVHDLSAVLLIPLPHFVDKRVTAEIVLGDILLLLQLSLDNALRMTQPSIQTNDTMSTGRPTSA